MRGINYPAPLAAQTKIEHLVNLPESGVAVALTELADPLVSFAHRHDAYLGVLLVDLDHFKTTTTPTATSQAMLGFAPSEGRSLRSFDARHPTRRSLGARGPS
ncbi:MAG: hypothetical protein NVS3B12_05110 [Acidimicrobiales bacterium]